MTPTTHEPSLLAMLLVSSGALALLCVVGSLLWVHLVELPAARDDETT
jgi:hypothetical protein